MKQDVAKKHIVQQLCAPKSFHLDRECFGRHGRVFTLVPEGLELLQQTLCLEEGGYLLREDASRSNLLDERVAFRDEASEHIALVDRNEGGFIVGHTPV